MEKWICLQCNCEFTRYKTQIRNPKKTFCSNACKGLWQKVNFSGKSNPNYKTGTYSQPSFCVCGLEKDYRADKCSKCSKTSFGINTKNIWLDLDLLIKTVAVSSSFEEVANKMNVKRQTITKYIVNNDLDIKHFRPGRGRPLPADQIFCKGEIQRNGILKTRILKEKLKVYICECGQGPTWNSKELILQLDHVNGDSTDNRLDNLRFLCPNCHTQTPTFCGKNAKHYASERK